MTRGNYFSWKYTPLTVLQVLDKLDEEEIAKMDADEIMARQVEELEKEKKELQVDLHKGIVYEIFNVLLLISQGGGRQSPVTYLSELNLEWQIKGCSILSLIKGVVQ